MPINITQLNTAQQAILKGAIDPLGVSGVDITARNRGMFGGIANGPVSSPVEFTWDFTKYPLNVYRTGPGKYGTDLDPQSLMPANFWTTAAVYYADATKADNTGAGTTPATAKRSIRSCIAAAVAASATGVIVYVRAGLYDRTKDMLNSSAGSGTIPEIPVAIIGYGGRVDHGPVALLTWTADTTYTTTYTAARTNVARVLDVTRKDEEGNYVELPAIADAATLNAATTEEGWFQNAGNVLVKRKDGKVVSDANTWVLLTNSSSLNFGAQAAYVAGINAIGGVTGTLQASEVSTNNIIAVDCSFSHSGSIVQSGTGSGTRAVSIDNRSGIAAFFRCRAGQIPTDAFNFHMANQATAASPLHALTVDCRGIYCGVTVNNNNQSSCNGWTLHENVVGIDINGVYHTTRGNAVANIDASKAWLLGTTAGLDLGDGSFPSIAFRAGDTAKIWIQEGRATKSAYSMHASSGTSPQIYTKSCQDGGGLRTGNVTSY